MTTPDPLVRTRIRVEQDVFAVRQLGREVGRLVGLEAQDQIRLATALSEVGRLMVAGGRDSEVVFAAAPHGVPALTVTLQHPEPGGAARLTAQLAQVGRLVDAMEVRDGSSERSCGCHVDSRRTRRS